MAYEPGRFEDRIIAFDYDGTLGEEQHPEHPEITAETHEMIDRLKRLGYKVIISTARESLDADAIAENSGIDRVHTGKPIADLYIDDKGLLPNGEVLEGYIEYYFDQQTDYLQKLVSGQLESPYVTNIANVPENPDYKEKHDDDYRVYIPLTGGMDSITLWQMAQESGLPAHPIYIDAGQEYAELEIAKANEFTDNLEVVNLELPFKEFQHILLGRNAAVIFTIAQLMKDRNEWGEIWFGNLAGESPVHGGDKSKRFFNDTQSILSMAGHDVRIQNPLAGIDKPDEVQYWLARDIDKLIDSKSCFSAEENSCGECQTCFRKWSAFMSHGIDIRDSFANTNIVESFKPYKEKYEQRMGEALEQQDFSHYSPSRISTTLASLRELK